MRRLRGCGAWRMSSMRASRCIWRSCRCPHTSRCTRGPKRPPSAACRTVRRVCVAPRPRRRLPCERLQALGLLRPGFSAIGALGCEAQDLELLAHHGACVIGCPQAELRLGAAPRALPGLAGSARRARHRQPRRRGRFRPARRGAHRGAAVEPAGGRGAAPGDTRRRHRARSRSPDRLDRAGQGCRSHLHRPRRPCRRARRAGGGGDRVWRHPGAM